MAQALGHEWVWVVEDGADVAADAGLRDGEDGNSRAVEGNGGMDEGSRYSAVPDWWLPDGGQGGSRKGNSVCGGGVSD